MKSLSFLILLVSLCGCAAQSSFKAYYDARDNLAKAKKIDPGHPFLARAELELEAGQRALNEARYSRAARSFQLVNRDAEKIIQTRYPKVKLEGTGDEVKDLADVDRWASEQSESYRPLPAPQTPVTFGAAVSENPKDRVETSKSQSKEKNRMNLPAEALARYLAQKKTIHSGVSSGESSKSSEALDPKVESAAQKITFKVDNKDSNESAKNGQPEETADSDLEAVKPPPAVEPASKPTPGSELKARTSGALEKLEDTISFVPNETQILPKAQSELDRLSVFLLENPSYSLRLKAGQALGETENLVKARFEGVRDYLEAKGVARDQVQLDPEPLSAKNPVFELFLVEH